MAADAPDCQWRSGSEDRGASVGYRQSSGDGGGAGLVSGAWTHHAPVGPIKVPTLYIWGDADDTVGRMAAEGTGEFIAAPYQFAPLEGVGHFAADQAPERVTALLLQHLARHPL